MQKYALCVIMSTRAINKLNCLLYRNLATSIHIWHTHICAATNLQSFASIYFSYSTRLLCDFILSIVAIVLTFLYTLVYTIYTQAFISCYVCMCVNICACCGSYSCPPVATMWSKNSPYWIFNNCNSAYNYNICNNKHYNNN